MAPSRSTPVMWALGREPPPPAPVEPITSSLEFPELVVPRGKDWPADAPIINMSGRIRHYE